MVANDNPSLSEGSILPLGILANIMPMLSPKVRQSRGGGRTAKYAKVIRIVAGC
jgi:hypothetical protein